MSDAASTPSVRDQAQRVRALDPTESFIVQAPAGSGKTELLIQRFLTLLGMPSVDEPESIIAITFTRKAAGEMRHRLISALKNAADSDGSETLSLHEQRTRHLAERVLARDRERQWQLTDHPSRLRIQTIDALSASLVRRMPWISRMGAPPRPEESPGHLYLRAAHATLELLDSDTAKPSEVDALTRLLAHLDNNVGRVAALLSGMLGRRDQWLRHVVRNPTTDAFRDAIESALKQIVTDELDQLARCFPEEALVDTVTAVRFAASNLRREGSRSPIVDCMELDSLPDTDTDDLGKWQGLAEMFLKRTGERRTRLDKRQGFPPTDEGRQAKHRCLAIQLDEDLRERLHRVRSFPPTSLGDARWSVLQALMDLLPVAVGQLTLVFQAEGKVDFTGIAHASRSALGSPDVPTDLAFAFDCRIQHLLVDEFQDTSQSQFDFLRSLTADWQTGDGRTLFLVGDPMQSIYAFREAEVGLFLRARQHGVGDIQLKPLGLSVNFRSDRGIVEWVNNALGAAFPAHEDTFTGAVTYTPSVAFDTSAPEPAPDASTPQQHRAVTVHPSFEKDPDAEAEEVLEIVREARVPEGTPRSGSIAVLVRSRSHLTRIVAALRRAGERFRAVEIDALGARPVVQDLLALTRALLHSADRVSWLAVLRAPWCGLTLEDMHHLVVGDRESAVWDLIGDPARRSLLSDDGQQRLRRVSAVLEDAIEKRATMPVRRWIEGVWVNLGGPATVEGRTDLEDAAAYLDLLEESARGADLQDEQKFERAVAQLYARPDVEADESLQLLTVHKAKGLEFDTVILPGLGRWLRHDDPRLMMWLEYIDPKGSPQLLMAPIRETGSDDDPLYGYLRRIQAVKNDYESTRLLYVAATRARRSLHLLGNAELKRSDVLSIKPPDSRSLLVKIWDAVQPQYERAFESGGVGPDLNESLPHRGSDGGSGNLAVPLRRLSLDWNAPPETPPIERAEGEFGNAANADEADLARHPTFDWASELQRRVGIVVHAMLQQARVGESGRESSLGWDSDNLLAALKTEGLAGDKLAEAHRRVENALEWAVTDSRGRWILSEHDEDRREYALTAATGSRLERLVLDRTFVDDGVRWIIDYKTGMHEGGGREAFLDNEQARYCAQLENYATAMQQIDARPIRLGLYFPLLQGWREWAFNGSAPATEPVLSV